MFALINLRAATPHDDVATLVAIGLLLKAQLSEGTPQSFERENLGRAFMEQGFRRVKSCGQRGYVVELRTGEEIQRLQRTMVNDYDYDDDVDSGQ